MTAWERGLPLSNGLKSLDERELRWRQEPQENQRPASAARRTLTPVSTRRTAIRIVGTEQQRTAALPANAVQRARNSQSSSAFNRTPSRQCRSSTRNFLASRAKFIPSPSIGRRSIKELTS